MQEILSLSPTDQTELLDKLTHYAHCEMRKLTWRGARLARDGLASEAFGADDFALEAIKRTLEGRRKWNRGKYPTLLDFLRSVVDSLLSSAVNSLANRKETSLSPRDAAHEILKVYDVEDHDPLPFEVVLDRERQNQFARFRDEAHRELSNDPFLLRIVECLEAGVTAPRDIAQLLSTTASEVNNAVKRLGTKLKRLEVPSLSRPAKPRRGT